MCDISQAAWPVLFTNEAWGAETGMKKEGEEAIGNFWDVFQVSRGLKYGGKEEVWREGRSMEGKKKYGAINNLRDMSQVSALQLVLFFDGRSGMRTWCGCVA